MLILKTRIELLREKLPEGLGRAVEGVAIDRTDRLNYLTMQLPVLRDQMGIATEKISLVIAHVPAGAEIGEKCVDFGHPILEVPPLSVSFDVIFKDGA